MYCERPRPERAHLLRFRARAVLLAAAVALSGCSASGTAMVGEAEVLAEQPSPAPTVTPAVPTPTATPRPTPTALPTPTPTPAPLIPTDLLQRSIDENFVELDELGTAYSFQLHVDGLGVIADRNGSDRLLPASNQKIITAVGALELLAADFAFVTEVRLNADGDVFIVGGGDPTLRKTDIVRLADEMLVGLSVEIPEDGQVTVRDLVVDPSYFPSTRTGPGWPARYVPADVGPMSGLMIDDNQHRGDDAYVADPDTGNARLIAQIFDEAGITVSGQVRVGEADPAAALVAWKRSARLDQLVDRMLGRSDNEIADALVRQIGLDHAGEGEIPAGQAVIFEHLAGLGLDLGPPAGDGSGLSRDNRLSARELVDVLRLAASRPSWPVVIAGLSGAGVDGTLAARLEGDTTIGNVRAKTGTLDDVRALSGILTTVDGASVIFSFLINGDDAEEAVEPMDRIIVAYASATLPQLVE